MEITNKDEAFGPKPLSFQDVWMNALGALIAWIVGSILILMIVVGLWAVDLDIKWTFDNAVKGVAMDSMFPFMLSIIMFVSSYIVVIVTYLFLNYIQGEKYKKNSIIFGQLSFFSLIVYIFLTPLYLKATNPSELIYTFVYHSLILVLWINLIFELLNNYRYILIWFYWSFIGLFLSTLITISIFNWVESSYAKLILLLILLPMVNTLMMFFKWLFEFTYYKYHKATWYDQLGDVFYQIQTEEEEELREAEEESRIE